MQFKPNDIIEFDVGGINKVKITYGDLIKVKGSKLEKKFKGKIPVQKNGSIYINRPFIAFKLMLDFLKNDMQT